MIYLLIVSIVWAFSFSLIKVYLVGLSSYLVAGIRLSISMLLFLPFIRFKGLKGVLFFKLLLLGTIQYGIMYASYIYSYKFLKSYEVAIFTIFTPLFIILFSKILEKKVSYKAFVPAVLSVLGAGIIVFKELNTAIFWYGFFLIQLANLSFAFGQIFYKKIKQQTGIKDRELFSVIYIGAVLFVLSMVFMNNQFVQVKLISKTQWQVLLYLGIVASGLCFYLWNKGASLVNDKILSVMNNIKIPLAVFVSVVIFKEQANIIRLVIGLFFMIYALYISYRSKLWKQ